MITIGLSSITESFNSTLVHVSWIVTIYLIIMTALQPLAGKLGDLYGNRRLFLIGLVLFLIASLICMYAPTLSVLIVGRALQAIGGALISPNGTAILRYMIPKEKLAKSFGVFGFVMSIGAAIGPLLGAVLIGVWGWHSTFWVNVPLIIVSFLVAYLFLPKTKVYAKSPLDSYGALFLAVFLTVLVLIVTNKMYANIWMWLICIGTFILFVKRETSIGSPLIDFKLFKKRSFTSANIAILLNNGIMYCTLLLLPLTFATGYFTLGQVGLLLFIYSVSISIFSWLGGNFEGKFGRGRMIAWAFISSAIGLTFYLYIPSNESLLIAAIILFVGGIGSGLGVPSMQAASLQAVKKEMSGVASGIYSTFRYIGSTMASVLISLQFSFHWTIFILIGAACIGVIFSKGFNEARDC